MIEPIKPSDYKAVWENLARALVDIRHRDEQSHFAYGDYEEVLGGAKPGHIEYPALVASRPVIPLEDKKSDNVHKLWKFTLGVVTSYDPNLPDETAQKEDETSAVIDQIIAWLEKKKLQLPRDRKFTGFDRDKVEIYFLHRIYDGTHMGCFIDFELPSPHHFIINNDMWDEIPD